MKFTVSALLLTLSLGLVAAQPPFDPAGEKNIGNGQGGQFIGGQCLSDADCGSACCARPTGICSGPAANFQNGKQGCGFVSGSASAPAASSNNNAAVDTSSVAGSQVPGQATSNNPPNVGGPPFDPAGDKNVGNGAGIQFVGGQCLSNADCGLGCCAGPSGICSGPGAAFQNGKTGCGFVIARRLVRF